MNEKNKRPVYLDNCSTTCMDSNHLERINEVMLQQYGNPSSLHQFGTEAYKLVQDARYAAASLLSVPTETVFFTSGATESNNIAIIGGMLGNPTRGRHIITTAVEHSSVLEPIKILEKELKFSVDYIYPDPSTGMISVEDVLGKVMDDTAMVSIMSVNNETGNINPVGAIAKAIRHKNKHTLIHCDATQGFGKIDTSINSMDVDFLSASSHKIHGPKGIGLLYVKQGTAVKPLKFGGQQEGGIIPGTENVAGIFGFGLAIADASINMRQRFNHVKDLKEYLIRLIADKYDACINSNESSSPYVLNFSLKGIDGLDFMDFCSENYLYLSTGSACTRGAASNVLKAMGYDQTRTQSAIRIGLSHNNTKEDIDFLISLVDKYLRKH